MPPHKIILDTDPGVDDVVALLLILASPEVDLEAITVTFGNTALKYTYSNVLKVYSLVEQHLALHPHDVSRFPNYNRPGHTTVLAKGRDQPLEGELHLAGYFHGPDGLSDISNTHPQFTAPDSHPSIEESPLEAYELILKVLKREPPGTVSLLAAGPLTNLALALRHDAETVRRARRIVVMGGALDVPGNTAPVAEFNFFADPYAALEVMQAPNLPLFLLPLDITNRHAAPFNVLIPAEHDPSPYHTPLQSFITAILTRPRHVMNMLGEGDAFQLHDPLAAWFVIKHADIPGTELGPEWGIRRRRFGIERKGELTRGMCVVDRRGTEEAAGSVRAEDGIETAVAVGKIQQEEEGGVAVVVRTPGLQDLTDALLERVIRVTGAPVDIVIDST